MLSADSEYQQIKEITDIKERPDGMIDGLKKGVKGLGLSCWIGPRDLVIKTSEGAKKGGISGCCKGLGAGVLETVCLPLSGVLDLVSKTTAGIESAVDGGLCKANDKKRRYARAFYKEEGMFKAYSDVNAKLYSKLRSKSMYSMKAK